MRRHDQITIRRNNKFGRRECRFPSIIFLFQDCLQQIMVLIIKGLHKGSNDRNDSHNEKAHNTTVTFFYSLQLIAVTLNNVILISQKKVSTFGTMMTTVEIESIRHSIFISSVRRSIFPLVCSVIFDFQMASSNSVGASFKFS